MIRSFDWMARPYRLLEHAVMGSCLDQIRLSLLDRLDGTRHVLVLGEGDGRFLEALLARHADVQVTVVERSKGMLRCARKRIAGGTAIQRVCFVCADARRWARQTPTVRFDAVVTLFFLDCFEGREQAQLIGDVSAHLADSAKWLWADFSIPRRGPRRLLAQILVGTLYWAFRCTTDIAASRLTDPLPHLKTLGFQTQHSARAALGLLEARLLRRA